MWKAIQSYFFNRAIRKIMNPNRVGKLRNLSDVHTIGLLFIAHSDEQIRQIKLAASALEKQQKRVSLLGYIPSLKKNQSPDFPFFTAKDISFGQVPGGEAVQSFAGQSFDLLIVTPAAGFLPFTYISQLSAAQLKAGVFDESSVDCYDFMIKQGPTDSTRNFIDKLLSYLQQIDCHG
jgi:hypothetical protein